MGLMDHVRDAEVIRKEMKAIRDRAEPIRQLRETINLRVEKDKQQVKDLSQQIFSIEYPIRELHVELMLAEKKKGGVVVSETVTGK